MAGIEVSHVHDGFSRIDKGILNGLQNTKGSGLVIELQYSRISTCPARTESNQPASTHSLQDGLECCGYRFSRITVCLFSLVSAALLL